ncbi:TetR family transcriptional regulator [Nonomuraea sp. NPDC004297]
MPATNPGDVIASAEDSRRSELLRIAADVFSYAGYTSTSLRDIAHAAGILAGSLYHHFPSKEALAVELISAFHAEIEATAHRSRSGVSDPLSAIVAFAAQVGGVVERHRAAAQMCRYDAPSTATEAMSSLVRRKLPAIESRWSELLRAAREQGAIRAGTDLPMVQNVLSEAVIDLALLGGTEPPAGYIHALTTLVLHGLAAESSAPADLDASVPMRIAQEHVATWSGLPEASAGGRRDLILATARDEFARRGYDATTMRDIAAALGTRPSSIYRHFTSKQDLLDAIVRNFSPRLLAAYEAVVGASGSAVERLDALFWLMASASASFRPDFIIVGDWWRELKYPADAPPEDNAARLRLLEKVIRDGIPAGEFVRLQDPAMLAVAVRAMLWVPLTDCAPPAVAQRHAFLRQCLLDGAAAPAERMTILSL